VDMDIHGYIHVWTSDLDCAVDIGLSMDVSKSFELNCHITRVIIMHSAPKDKATEENLAQGNEKVGLDPE